MLITRFVTVHWIVRKTDVLKRSDSDNARISFLESLSFPFAWMRKSHAIAPEISPSRNMISSKPVTISWRDNVPRFSWSQSWKILVERLWSGTRRSIRSCRPFLTIYSSRAQVNISPKNRRKVVRFTRISLRSCIGSTLAGTWSPSVKDSGAWRAR